MGSAALDLSKTEAFLKGVRIPFVSPSATEFGVLSKTFMHSPEQPTGIAQPGTAEEVATIIKHCVAEKVPFVVRTGGHDVTKSTLVANVLSINLRKLDHVQVSADKKTARVGGGILSGALLEALAPHGLEVPTAAVPSVGWLSCATMAGYTLMSPSMGLCCDSLLGAKVVDAKGEIVEASERMMKGIRGGGGNFGVIVEFTVKVHPLLEVGIPDAVGRGELEADKVNSGPVRSDHVRELGPATQLVVVFDQVPGAHDQGEDAAVSVDSAIAHRCAQHGTSRFCRLLLEGRSR